MLDPIGLRLVKPYLQSTARMLKSWGITPDQVSITGFILGMTGALSIALHYYLAALVLILLNRIADGLDGALARQTRTTDSGAYLDITLDFIFYSAIVLGFAIADPAANSLAAAALIFSFIGTGSSFLAFAIMAERRKISDLRLPGKGFYYLGGLAEGTETILFFVFICLFPRLFPATAWFFTAICCTTTFLRIFYGYKTLKKECLPEKDTTHK